MDDLISRADALAVVMHSTVPVKDIKALPGVGWIPVAERLPERYRDVITFRGDAGIEFVTNDGSWLFDNEVEDTVTHWMPLPEPPKGDSDE